ncbi:hypothetical protein F4678DRAFT_230487 [Xylaria arbuscula]|nr:hypothetical protein F4678DRAFT_230487 [Xylaria arbuscula]
MGNYDKDHFSPSPRTRSRSGRPRHLETRRATIQGIAVIIGMVAVWYAFKDAHKWSEARKAHSAARTYHWPQSTNETAMMERFWNNYTRIMTGYDHDDEYFVSAIIATEQIEKMFKAIPAPSPQEETAYADMQRRIEWRARQVRLLYDEWEKVMQVRERVMYDILNPEKWRVYLDEQPIDETKAAEVSGSWVAMTRKFGIPEPTACVDDLGIERKPVINITVIGNGKTEWEDRNQFYEQNMASVAEAGSRITGELDRLYIMLFKDWDWETALSHLREARKTEDGFIKQLRVKSPMHHIWSNCYPISLKTLVERMEEKHRAHVNICRTLKWLKARFPYEKPVMIQDPAAWLGSAKELFRQWPGLGNATEEGILMMLRRRHVRQHWKRTYAEASWADWKSRNCGCTSCYEVDVNDGKPFLEGKAVAEIAADEAKWVKDIEGNGTRVSRDKYEEACCAKGHLGHRLKHNSNAPQETNLNLYIK